MANITAGLWLPDLEGEPIPPKSLKGKQNLFPLKGWVEDAARSQRLGPPRIQKLNGVKFRGRKAKPFLADQLLYSEPIWRDMVVKRGGEKEGEALEVAQDVLPPNPEDKPEQDDLPDETPSNDLDNLLNELLERRRRMGRVRKPSDKRKATDLLDPSPPAPRKPTRNNKPPPPGDKREQGDLPDEKHKGKEKWPPLRRSPPPPPAPPKPKDKGKATDLPDFPGRRNKPTRRDPIPTVSPGQVIPPQYPDEPPNPQRVIPIRRPLRQVNKPIHPVNKTSPKDKRRQDLPEEGYLKLINPSRIKPPQYPDQPPDPQRVIPIRSTLPSVELGELEKPIHPVNKASPKDKSKQRIPDEGYLETVEEEEVRPLKSLTPKRSVQQEYAPNLPGSEGGRVAEVPSLRKPEPLKKEDILKPLPGEDEPPFVEPPKPVVRSKPRSSRFGERATPTLSPTPSIISPSPIDTPIRFIPPKPEARSRLSEVLREPITPTEYFGGVAGGTNRDLDRKEYAEKGRKIFERFRRQANPEDVPIVSRKREVKPVVIEKPIIIEEKPEAIEEQKPDPRLKRKQEEAPSKPGPSSLRLGKRQRTSLSEDPRNRELLDSLKRKKGVEKKKEKTEFITETEEKQEFEPKVRETRPKKRERPEEESIPTGEREKPKPFDLDIRNIPVPGGEPTRERIKGKFLPHKRPRKGDGGEDTGGPDIDRGGERTRTEQLKPIRMRVAARPPPPPQRPKEKKKAADVLEPAPPPPKEKKKVTDVLDDPQKGPKEKRKSEEPEDLGWTWLRREEPALAPWGSTLEFEPGDTSVRLEKRGKKRKRKEERKEKETEEIRNEARRKAQERANELRAQGRGDLADKLLAGLESGFQETDKKLGSIPASPAVVEYGRQVRQEYLRRGEGLSSELRLSFRPGFTGDGPQRSLPTLHLPAGPQQKKPRIVSFQERQPEYTRQFRIANPDPALQTVQGQTNKKNPTLVLRRK